MTSSAPRETRLVMRQLRRKRATSLSFSASDLDQPVRQLARARYSLVRLATTNPVSLRINNVSVDPSFAGLSAAGLYQINFTVPAGLGTGDVALVATAGGASTQPSVVIPLQ
jgi:uncharacterized protein (TIGR03437 family)